MGQEKNQNHKKEWEMKPTKIFMKDGLHYLKLFLFDQLFYQNLYCKNKNLNSSKFTISYSLILY